MPSTTNNSPTPPPLDEAAMLAWIEGRLSKIEESKLAMQARPGTTERIQQMQANRRALQSVRDERAPAELMDRVLAALERDALVGLSNGQDLSDHPPISIAPAIKEKEGASWTTRHAPALALAAGIALLLTGVAYWGSLLFKSGKTQQLAQNTAPLVQPGSPGEHLLAKGDAPNTTESNQPEISNDARVADIVQPAPTMTPGRMLALAREGRLVMRVQSRDLANLPEIAAIENSKMDRTWRLTSKVPDQVVAAITPKPAPLVGPLPEQPMTLAGTKDQATPPTPTLGAPSAKRSIEPEDPASRVKAKFLIDLPNTEKALNQIKLVFADRLKAGVVFEELDKPVKLPEAQDPETLLWWTLPPAQWVEHVTVPVVVEAK
jgi:hypothetical protein